LLEGHWLGGRHIATWLRRLFSLAGPYGGAQDEQQNFWQMIVLQCDITGL
jgi:hypothetical protein